MAALRWKRWLFLFHRWMGIVLCLFFAAWFVSGLFMMYVDFPQLTRAERLAGLPALDLSSAKLTSANAAAYLRADELAAVDARGAKPLLPAGSGSLRDSKIAIDAMRIGMLLQRPIFEILVDGNPSPRIVFADDGTVLHSVAPEFAEQVARDFAQRAGLIAAVDAQQVRYRESVGIDQWTVSSALNVHRPLLLIAVNDAAGTELYVSSRSGAVVRDTDRRERVLNYFGAVTHWLYPTFIRRYPDAWSWLVDIVSGSGSVLALSGLWIGVLRWRRKRPEGKNAVPYRGLLRWHYFAGIAFGLTTLTWVVSGLLSMNPGRFNPPRAPAAVEREVFSGTSFDVERFKQLPPHLDASSVETELLFYDGQPFYCVVARDGKRQLIAAAAPARNPNMARLNALATKLLPGAPLIDSHWLTEYDDYYYSRHPERGDKPLPMLRVEFGDDVHTWFYIDPRTGELVERSTSINRWYRWLYNGLHSWDIRWLWERRPLWDIAVITFSLGGLSLSLFGVVIGYRRLRQSAASGRW
ncbi:MAG TPA: hypothetical protein VLC91_07465 [Spongiibacteraceae bacterium]|nr:hypothetical protein [Spongiibacteraceae bacterium]